MKNTLRSRGRTGPRRDFARLLMLAITTGAFLLVTWVATKGSSSSSCKSLRSGESYRRSLLAAPTRMLVEWLNGLHEALPSVALVISLWSPMQRAWPMAR